MLDDLRALVGIGPSRVDSPRSRSSLPDTIRNNPAAAKAGGRTGCRVARPLGKAAAPELAGLQGARTSARSAAADGGAEIYYVKRHEPQSLLASSVLAHPLAEGTLIDPILALTEKYPKVRVRLLSDLTVELFRRLLAGELDVAAVLLPEGRTAPPPLLTNIIASDRMEIVQGAGGADLDGDWKSLGRAPWVLNPPGCPLRASLIDRMERDGFAPMIAAEIHNMHLQLAFVQSGYGVGLLPARFIARNYSVDTVKILRPPSFDLRPSVAIVRAGQLGALGKAVELLAHGFRQLFEAADTAKPVTRRRRGLPANRRVARPRK